ncbi:hypothetical protein [Catenulispora sp. GP43]|uniref:hypothetical protein n=1 Tax=Catenulispora sp. GP43 TaxID=3156263 RepID=UPI003518A7F4
MQRSVTTPATGSSQLPATDSMQRSAATPATAANHPSAADSVQRSATSPSATPIQRSTATPATAPNHPPAAAPIQRSATIPPVTTSATWSPRVQRAVPIHRPTPASAAPLPLPMAFRPPAAPPLLPPIQRAGGVGSFLADAVSAQARDTRQRFNDTVDDQVGSFTDKIADLRDAAALVRDPSQFKQVVKQRGLDMFAEHNPIAGTLLGYRRGESEQGSGGARGGSGRGRGRGEHQEMEQLAEKLVAPLARLLRTELRMDRERMGRLRDSGR